MDQNQPKTLDIRDILDSMPDRNQEASFIHYIPIKAPRAIYVILRYRYFDKTMTFNKH